MGYLTVFHNGSFKEGKELYRREGGQWVEQRPSKFNDGGGLYVYDGSAWRRAWRNEIVLGNLDLDPDYSFGSVRSVRFNPSNYPDLANQVAAGDTIILRPDAGIDSFGSDTALVVSGWPAGVNVVVDCEVSGWDGRDGGAGTITSSNPVTPPPGTDGGQGDTALRAESPVALGPNALIRGGGGGGGGGGSALFVDAVNFNTGEVSMAVAFGETGGSVDGDPFTDSNGSTVVYTTIRTGGFGDPGQVNRDGKVAVRGGFRGAAGDYGQPGQDGTSGYRNSNYFTEPDAGKTSAGGQGGPAGIAVDGMSNVTSNQGTIVGPTIN